MGRIKWPCQRGEAATRLPENAAPAHRGALPESLRPFFSTGSISLVGPRGMNPAVVEKIANAVRQAVTQTEVVEAMRAAGAEPNVGDAAALRSEIEELAARWGPDAREIVALVEGKTTGAPQK